jgi:hypothetical protein
MICRRILTLAGHIPAEMFSAETAVVPVLIRCIVIFSPLFLPGCLFGSKSFARDTGHTTSVVALMEDAKGVDPDHPTRVASLVC